MTQKLFTGTYWDVMPQLLGEGLVPSTTKMEMERRVAARGTPDEKAVWGNWNSTADGIVISKQGAVKIRVNSPDLRTVRNGMPLVNYGIGHEDPAYAAIEAAEISPKVVKRDFNRHLRPAEVLENEGWLQIAQGDVALLKEYRDALFSLREENGYSREGMGIWIPDATKKAHVERALWVGRFGGSIYDYRGGVGGVGLLNNARLVGVAPEALAPRSGAGAPGISLDDALASVYEPLRPFLSQATQAQAQEVLRGALRPVLAVRDTQYRDQVLAATTQVAGQYLGQKPLVELETALAALKRE